MWRDFTKALHEVWRASGEPCSSYRPDLHYMRGPGPKWHAKYDHLASHDSPSTVPSVPVLREAAEQHA
jgi:hypothetical protein